MMDYSIGALVLLQCREPENWALKGIILNQHNDKMGKRYEIFCFAARCIRIFNKKDLKLLNNNKSESSD